MVTFQEEIISSTTTSASFRSNNSYRSKLRSSVLQGRQSVMGRMSILMGRRPSVTAPSELLDLDDLDFSDCDVHDDGPKNSDEAQEILKQQQEASTASTFLGFTWSSRDINSSSRHLKAPAPEETTTRTSTASEDKEGVVEDIDSFMSSMTKEIGTFWTSLMGDDKKLEDDTETEDEILFEAKQ
ncbi:expressed unknown protein [Seminavis robusta]|uniref:Uncharacterized protein n=1 Tax=Seminavis robusta TaxID=568900 RepID=A0A9N8DSF7_9STRA|nr:expressed unknown protein [Seminavis robusta]|eukprot:Sro309_g113810.1 n/a (184) ;mRNA; r:40465-41016